LRRIALETLLFRAFQPRLALKTTQKMVVWKPEWLVWVSKTAVNLTRNFMISLAAVLLGNAIYFLIMPWLPPAAQHRSYRLLPDLGLLIDFWLCLVCYGAIHLLARGHEGRSRTEQRR
jgi:hypothetical protein